MTRRGRSGQFTVRSLLAAMVASALLFAVQQGFGAAGTLLVVWVAALVGAHVLANAWGSRVRPARQEPPPTADDARFEPTPASRLSREALFERRWAKVSAASAVLSAAAAIAALAFFGWRIGVTGILLGGVSAAVIGAWGGFLAVSFVDVARQAWKEATEPPKGSPLPPRR